MANNQNNVDNSGAAVVCGHCVSGEYPILYGERSETDDPVDSGWQFLCNSGLEERIEEAQIWSLNSILRKEPSLVAFVELPPGTIVWRDNINTAWQTVFDESVK